jgi:hypothetical protein
MCATGEMGNLLFFLCCCPPLIFVVFFLLSVDAGEDGMSYAAHEHEANLYFPTVSPHILILVVVESECHMLLILASWR